MLSPVVYQRLTGVFNDLIWFGSMSHFKSHSSVIIYTFKLISNLLSAAATALVTSLPSCYLAPKQQKITTCILIVLMLMFPAAVFLTQSDIKILSIVDMAGQLLFSVMAVHYFSVLGVNLSNKQKENAESHK